MLPTRPLAHNPRAMCGHLRSKRKHRQRGKEQKFIYGCQRIGQRTFKSESQSAQTLPGKARLGESFTDWLEETLGWLFADKDSEQNRTNQTRQALLGRIYSHGEGALPNWALLGEYGNGGASSSGRVEYIWLPRDDGQAIPVAMFRSNRYYSIHSDHLGTPRLIKDDEAKPVWQWSYSAFGDNKPTGVLKATTNPNSAVTNTPALLAASSPAFAFNLRFPGQYADSETGLFYKYYRSYQATQGRYTQADPIGLSGGMNRFGYVEGNAINGYDSLGLAACVVNFPDYPIDTGFGFSSSSLGGHGGILTFDSQGSTRYAEFGRYSPNAGNVFGDARSESEGNVRRIPVPDLVIDPRTGQPTPSSLEALQKALSARAGKNTRADLTCDNSADDKKVNKYIDDFAKSKERPPYSWKPWASNQCRDFANRAFGAGK